MIAMNDLIFDLYDDMHQAVLTSLYNVHSSNRFQRILDIKDNFNCRFNTIISAHDYDPSQWITEYNRFQIKPSPRLTKLQLTFDNEAVLFLTFINFLNPNEYHRLPEDWWLHVCGIIPDTIKQLMIENPQMLFLEPIFLLHELHNK